MPILDSHDYVMFHLLFASVDTSHPSNFPPTPTTTRIIPVPSTTELSTSSTCLAPKMVAAEESSLAFRATQEGYVEQKDRCVEPVVL